MSGSPHTGEQALLLSGRQLTLVYDWRALSALQKLLGATDVFSALDAALAGRDPLLLAEIVAVGLARHHPDVTPEAVLDAALPFLPTQRAVTQGIEWCLWGPDGAPKADPPPPVAQAATPAGTSSLPH
jgi:hypothetical protein